MMSQTQQQCSEGEASIWSWLLKLLSTNFLVAWLSRLFCRGAQPVSRCSSFDFCEDPYSDFSTSSVKEETRDWTDWHRLPSLILEMLAYVIPGLSARHQLKRFCHLVAVKDEDNQNKAKAMLEHAEPRQISEMLLTRTTITDGAGRVFEAMSAYAYVFWAADIGMRTIMEQYMDDEMKAKAYEECLSMTEVNEVCFTFKGTTIADSEHFNPISEDDDAVLKALKPRVPAESFLI